MWLLMLYAPIRLFSLGLHNYKIEKQNKQIKTFKVVLLTRPGVCVCVCGGGGWEGGGAAVCVWGGQLLDRKTK